MLPHLVRLTDSGSAPCSSKAHCNADADALLGTASTRAETNSGVEIGSWAMRRGREKSEIRNQKSVGKAAYSSSGSAHTGSAAIPGLEDCV